MHAAFFRLSHRIGGVFGLIGIVCLMVAPSKSYAVYNANMQGLVDSVSLYTDGDYIYVRLVNQPTSHPTCNPSLFVISQDIPENRRNQMFARLMAAKVAGEQINIGFDNAADCAHGYIRLHRVG
jgi:hypothetical protein